MKVAIIGSGNIGADLLTKIAGTPELCCVMFAGRRSDSPGLRHAQVLGVRTSDRGVEALFETATDIDLIFDATHADAHRQHFADSRLAGQEWVDLTPSRIGKPYVPVIGPLGTGALHNISMITCGAQASLPIVDAVCRVVDDIRYIEVASTIASKSAGPATRDNIDEYVHATEAAITSRSGIGDTKAILIINPAVPEIDMITTVSFLASGVDLEEVGKAVERASLNVREYVPGYRVITQPVYQRGRLTVRVTVHGRGDYLPSYAGNLDIITCAALAAAKTHEDQRRRQSETETAL